MKRFLRNAVSCLALLSSPAWASQATLVTPGPPLPMTTLASFLNGALLSVGSCNSGPTAPANGTGNAAFAGECWINTSGNPWVFSHTVDGAHWSAFGTLNTSNFAWTPSIGSSGAGGFGVFVANSETLTAQRTLTIKLNDGNRVLTLGGDFATAAAFTLAGAFPTTLTATGTTNVTLPAGTHTLAGLDVNQVWSGVQNFNGTFEIGGFTAILGGVFTTAAPFTQAGAFATTLTATATTNATLPGGTHTLAGLDVNQTFSGTETFSGIFNATGTFEIGGTTQSFPASGHLVGTTDSQALTGKTYNGLSIATSTGTLSIASGKTLTDTSGAGANLLLGTSGGGFTAFSGNGCTNQVVTAIAAVGTLTCANITNSFLASGTFANITGTGTLTSGATGAGFTLNLAISTISGILPAGNFPALTGDVTTSSGSVATTITAGAVTNAKLANAASGATLKGNPTAAGAAQQDFTIQGLTNLASPSATLDFLPIVDHTTGAIKNVTPGAIAGSTVAGVAAIDTQTGNFTTANGIDSSGKVLELTAARRTLPNTITYNAGASTTYVPSANVLWDEIWLTGGGAGGSASPGGGGGSGGGSGAKCHFILASPSGSYTISVAAAVSTQTSGNSTVWNGTIGAGGGSPGGNTTTGGAGGTNSGCPGDSTPGQVGGNPMYAGSPYYGGPGGGPGGGIGATTGSSAGSPVANSGGGGGGAASSAGSGSGGAGGNIVIIEHFGT